MSSLDVQIIHEDEIFTTSLYGKPTFSGVYTHFKKFFTIKVFYHPCEFAQVGLNYTMNQFV